MMTAEFVSGPLDGEVITYTYDKALREVLVGDDVYGCLDVCDSKDDLHLIYAHIETLERDDADA